MTPPPPPLTLAAARAEDLAAVRRLLRDYQASLGISLDFQDFEAELAGLPGEYVAPRGALLVARLGQAVVGTIALRPLQWPHIGEVKRLYVAPEARGHGAGLKLATRLLAIAGEMGYERLRLDTLPSMRTALALYARLGFREIAPYRFNPVAGACYLECELLARTPPLSPL